MNSYCPHEWRYFLAMEEDVERCSRFVEFDKENFGAHSIEFCRLLLAAGSEIDVLAKMICKHIQPGSNCGNINEYRNCIMSHYPRFATRDVEISRYQLTFHPWKEWASGTNPLWWKAYNDVKHERNNAFRDANLENMLAALSGYLVIVGYYLHLKAPDECYDYRLHPRLFNLVDEPANSGGARIFWYFEFPK